MNLFTSLCRVLPVGVLLLSACSSQPTVQRGSSPEPVAPPPTAKTVESATKPPAELTEEVLYEVITAEIAGQRGKLDFALQQYLSAAKESRDSQVAKRAARIALVAGDKQGAREAAALLGELSPDDLEAQQLAVVLYIRAGQVDRAREHVERVLGLAAGGPAQGFLIVSNLLGKDQDPRVALQILQPLVGQYANLAESHYALGVQAARVGRLASARQNLDRALQLQPGWTAALGLQARVLVRLGKLQVAEKLLAEALEEKPDDKILRTGYAQILVQTGKSREAREQFRVLLERTGETPDVLLAMGVLSLELEELDEASGYFSQLFEKTERRAEAAYYLAQIRERQGDVNGAKVWYAKVDRGPRQLDAQLRIVALLARQGHVDEARARLKSLRLRAGKHGARLFLAEGDLLRSLGQQEAAMELYDEALDAFPGDSDLLYARALTGEKLGRLDILERDLRTILKKEPDNANALNALGYTLADQTDRLEEAERYIRRAMELKPDNPAILDSMGWLQYRLGNLAESAAYLRRALELEHDSEIAAHLGEVLWMMGDRESARAVLERALAAYPDSEILLEATERFK